MTAAWSKWQVLSPRTDSCRFPNPADDLLDQSKTGVPTIVGLHDYYAITRSYASRWPRPKRQWTATYSQRFGRDLSSYLKERRDRQLAAGRKRT